MSKNILITIFLFISLINFVSSSEEKEFTCLTNYLTKLNKNTIYQFAIDFDKCILSQDKYKYLYDYLSILSFYKIKYDYSAMCHANVSKFDAKTVLALIIGAIRAERMSDGVLLSFLKDGCLIRWIKRLKDIDNQ